MAVRIFVSGIMYVAFVDGDILDSSDDLKDIAQVIADNHPDQIEDIKFTSPPDGCNLALFPKKTTPYFFIFSLLLLLSFLNF